ncbi:MAG: tripartite tricarboxylate transporter TctB family protein [Pseudomonadota bacterium]
MLTADRVIAASLMAFSAYLMWHATVLPIGWEGSSGPGGGAFPFWLSLVMLLASAGILVRSFIGTKPDETPFFDPDMIRSVIVVSVALIVTITAMQYLGTYVALIGFLLWYLRIFGGHGWVLTVSLATATPVFLFFFFEVTLKILLPKGVTEPLFLPLYAMFF